MVSLDLNSTEDMCPCDSGKRLGHCCGPLLSGRQQAATAQALMRSRYCAFVSRNADYLLRTWHVDTRPESINFHPRQRWLGLNVKQVEAGAADDQTGIVEFVARFKIDGAGQRLHERSRFLRVDGRWFYLDGEAPAATR